MHLFVTFILQILLTFTRFSAAQVGERVLDRDVTDIILCKDGPGRNSSDPYCSCKNDVISCDFSPLKTSDYGHEIRFVKGPDGQDGSIKRMCFCGGPDNLHIFLNNDIPFRFPRLHRVDFDNIPGVLHLRKAFVNYFSGDIYMSKVKVNTIHSGEFGRGDTFTVDDVSGLKCCSKIAPKQKLTRPVLHIQDTRLGLINSSGINSFHMWKTVIMNNVTMHHIEKNGIKLDNHGTNVSITNCLIESSNATSINLNYAANLFMARNTFSQDCHPLSFGSVSTRPGSNVILLENYFNNSMVIELDAQKVLLWLNHFNRWDNDTFMFLNKTSHQDRMFAMVHNVVEDISDLTPNDVPRKINLPGKSLILDSNILGYCDCSSQKQLSLTLTRSSCQTQSSKSATHACHLSMNEVQENCRSLGVCVTGRENYIEQLGDFLHTNHLSLDSTFIFDQLREDPVQYKLTRIADHVPGPKEYNSGISIGSRKCGLWMRLVVSLCVVLISFYRM